MGLSDKFSKKSKKKFLIAITLIYFLYFLVLYTPGEQGVNFCEEAAAMGEEAWRECVDYYIESGLTLDQITGKSPIPKP